MKKLMLFVAMLFFGVAAATAQEVQKEKVYVDQVPGKEAKEYYKEYVTSANPEEVAALLTGLMVDKLSLSAEQSSRIREINETRLTELQALLRKEESASLKVSLKGLEKKYNADLKGALTPKQYAQFEAFVAKYKS
jgi:Spy/CpxP family protein refolding chaperone